MEATSGNCWIICTLLYLDIFCARSVVVEGYPCFFYCILVFCWHIYFRSVLFLQSSVLFDDTWRKNIRRIVYLFLAHVIRSELLPLRMAWGQFNLFGLLNDFFGNSRLPRHCICGKCPLKERGGTLASSQR